MQVGKYSNEIQTYDQEPTMVMQMTSTDHFAERISHTTQQRFRLNLQLILQKIKSLSKNLSKRIFRGPVH